MAPALNGIYCCFPFIYRKCVNGSNPFSFMDIFLTFLSIGSFLADIGTDIIVILQYYINGHITWMLLTTSLVCVPSLIVQIFSVRWHIIDGTVSSFIWITHVFQLGVFQRYIQLILLGLKCRENRTYINLRKFNQQQSDICMLRLFESFMESAPQLVLQLYIMVSTDEWSPWTGISAVASIFSLSWGIAAYSKAMRNIQPEKNHLSWWGLLFQSLWRIGMVSSRVFSMVLFAAAYGSWLILIMAVHWICMTIWVFFQNTDFCTTWCEERIYNCVVGVIYCFCYFNIKEGHSRNHMTVYYIVVIAQNMSFLFAFFIHEGPVHDLNYLMMLSVPPGIVIGITSLLLYYRFFHPSGPIELFRSKKIQKPKVDKIDSKKEVTCDCCTLKTCRKLINNNNEFVENSQTLSVDCYSNEQLKEGLPTVPKLSDKINISCTSDIHRSHSLNCSVRSHEMNDSTDFSYFVSKQKSVANHHRSINYHFRPAAYCGLSSSKIHCSCLVLTRDSFNNFKTIRSEETINHSKSLPNLEINLECDNIQISIASVKSDCSDLPSNFDTNDTKESEFIPTIENDHVIHINI